MRYLITPMGKPRMTQRDAYRTKQNIIHGMRPIIAKYWTFKAEIQYFKVKLPEFGAKIKFCIPMPKSWSAKKKEAMNGTAHQGKPDLSNCLKALEDAVYKDDSKIWNYNGITKIWGYEGYIEID